MSHKFWMGLVVVVLATASLGAVAPAEPGPGDEINVIVNKANDVADLSMAEARKIF